MLMLFVLITPLLIHRFSTRNSRSHIGVIFAGQKGTWWMKCASVLTLQNSFYPRVSTRHVGEPQWYKTLFYITLHEVESAWWIIPAASSCQGAGGSERALQHAWNCSRYCRTSALSAWIIACLMTRVSDKTRFQTISRGANSLSCFRTNNLSRVDFYYCQRSENEFLNPVRFVKQQRRRNICLPNKTLLYLVHNLMILRWSMKFIYLLLKLIQLFAWNFKLMTANNIILALFLFFKSTIACYSTWSSVTRCHIENFFEPDKHVKGRQDFMKM